MGLWYLSQISSIWYMPFKIDYSWQLLYDKIQVVSLYTAVLAHELSALLCAHADSHRPKDLRAEVLIFLNGRVLGCCRSYNSAKTLKAMKVTNTTAILVARWSLWKMMALLVFKVGKRFSKLAASVTELECRNGSFGTGDEQLVSLPWKVVF